MLKLSVCPAVAEDAEAFAYLNETCFGQSHPVEFVRQQIKAILDSADERLLVAVYRGTMLGYIHARIDRRTYRAPRVTVLSVAVDKDYRRKHVATALFDAITAWAAQCSCDTITASVGGSRAAQSFFLSVGCEERLNRKQYVKLPSSTNFVKGRLEDYGKKE